MHICVQNDKKCRFQMIYSDVFDLIIILQTKWYVKWNCGLLVPAHRQSLKNVHQCCGHGVFVNSCALRHLLTPRTRIFMIFYICPAKTTWWASKWKKNFLDRIKINEVIDKRHVLAKWWLLKRIDPYTSDYSVGAVFFSAIDTVDLFIELESGRGYFL
jgi:hypothetical protein